MERERPRFFPALSLALFFARAPLSERLEQATIKSYWVTESHLAAYNLICSILPFLRSHLGNLIHLP